MEIDAGSEFEEVKGEAFNIADIVTAEQLTLNQAKNNNAITDEVQVGMGYVLSRLASHKCRICQMYGH